MISPRTPRRTLTGLLLPVAFLLAGAADATATGAQCPRDPNWAGSQEMGFTTREVQGRPVLIAEGRIDAAMVPHLEQALSDFSGFEIWLRSPGGDLMTALRMGQALRELGFSTRIPAGWTCAGACTYLFLAGHSRIVEPDGTFMISAHHDASRPMEPPTGDDDTSAERQRRAALLASELVDYLIRMGASRRILSDIAFRLPAAAAEQSSAGRRCLDAAALREYRVVTQDSQAVHNLEK